MCDNHCEHNESVLSEEEEKLVEEEARAENLKLMNQCIEDAKGILIKKGLMSDDLAIIDVAVALFDKHALHVSHWKERAAREGFDKK